MLLFHYNWSLMCYNIFNLKSSIEAIPYHENNSFFFSFSPLVGLCSHDCSDTACCACSTTDSALLCIQISVHAFFPTFLLFQRGAEPTSIECYTHTFTPFSCIFSWLKVGVIKILRSYIFSKMSLDATKRIQATKQSLDDAYSPPGTYNIPMKQ